MSSDYNELFQRLYQASGREMLAVYEELIRLADANKDLESAYEFRRQYSASACEEGFPEKGIVAFSWCLTQLDKDPELDDPYDLIWQYKVILELIPIFETVTRDQITKMQEDMAKRLEFLGESERTAHYYRSWNLMRMGDYEKASEYQDAYMAMKRSDMSDCDACERDRQVELMVRMHRDEDALKLGKSIMSGRMRCGEVPEFTNGHLVKSLARLGKENEATERAEAGYKLIRRDRKYLGTIGDLMLITTRNRNFDVGVRQVTKHLPWVVDCAAGELKFRFLDAVALFLEALAAEKPKPKKMRIPPELGCHRDSDTYDIKELSGWFASEAQRYADRFNSRNGNQRYDEIRRDNREIANM
ncbi:hypothetical protein LOC67_00245 [Stieleria sp. JC731]|uniref:hypothetical protein n=1 Tax=Pirellulaceae TaxID=2691357 RepID=UPI001E3CF04D|nr:hypothetical protein [Stieleria sp. JC731]MCC9598969.1 hypothetical protein [Stieleria sp. JC731]